MISTVLRLLNGILSLKTDVNVSIERNKQKNLEKNLFCWHLESHCQKREGSESGSGIQCTDPRIPDLFQNVTDPEPSFP
jgi:hypothetical protein